MSSDTGDYREYKESEVAIRVYPADGESSYDVEVQMPMTLVFNFNHLMSEKTVDIGTATR